MPGIINKHGARSIATSEALYPVNKNILRGLSPEDIYEIKSVKERLDFILSKKKSYPFVQIKKKIDKDLNEILRIRAPKRFGETLNISKEDRSQALRDEVLRMVSRARPTNGIPTYRGKQLDGDPVAFFKQHYARYIKQGQEVIFSIDLVDIDKALLTALRNSVPSEKMPLGNRAAKTDAIAAGRFSDGEASRHAAHVAKLARLKRREAHAEFA